MITRPWDPDWRQFFLWEVGVDGSHLRQLTGTLADRTAGAEGRETTLVEDFDPCDLPDGGIAFVSTRTQTHIRCQYGFRYFANFLLYRADGDGSHIRPLSFAEAPEWEPCVLDDGRILSTRWDYTNRHSYHFQSLWVTDKRYGASRSTASELPSQANFAVGALCSGSGLWNDSHRSSDLCG